MSNRKSSSSSCQESSGTSLSSSPSSSCSFIRPDLSYIEDPIIAKDKLLLRNEISSLDSVNTHFKDSINEKNDFISKVCNDETIPLISPSVILATYKSHISHSQKNSENADFSKINSNQKTFFNLFPQKLTGLSNISRVSSESRMHEDIINNDKTTAFVRTYSEKNIQDFQSHLNRAGMSISASSNDIQTTDSETNSTETFVPVKLSDIEMMHAESDSEKSNASLSSDSSFWVISKSMCNVNSQDIYKSLPKSTREEYLQINTTRGLSDNKNRRTGYFSSMKRSLLEIFLKSPSENSAETEAMNYGLEPSSISLSPEFSALYDECQRLYNDSVLNDKSMDVYSNEPKEHQEALQLEEEYESTAHSRCMSDVSLTSSIVYVSSENKDARALGNIKKKSMIQSIKYYLTTKIVRLLANMEKMYNGRISRLHSFIPFLNRFNIISSLIETFSVSKMATFVQKLSNDLYILIEKVYEDNYIMYANDDISSIFTLKYLLQLLGTHVIAYVVFIRGMNQKNMYFRELSQIRKTLHQHKLRKTMNRYYLIDNEKFLNQLRTNVLFPASTNSHRPIDLNTRLGGENLTYNQVSHDDITKWYGNKMLWLSRNKYNNVVDFFMVDDSIFGITRAKDFLKHSINLILQGLIPQSENVISSPFNNVSDVCSPVFIQNIDAFHYSPTNSFSDILYTGKYLMQIVTQGIIDLLELPYGKSIPSITSVLPNSQSSSPILSKDIFQDIHPLYSFGMGLQFL